MYAGLRLPQLPAELWQEEPSILRLIFMHMRPHSSLRSVRRSAFDLIVIGGVNTDWVMRVHRFPVPGHAATAEYFRCLPGGKGLNQAIAAARLGASVALVAMLGDDHHAEEIRERLESEGVDTRCIFRSSNAHTGATTILVDEEGQSLRAAFPGANRLLLPREIEEASALISEAGMVLAQLEVPLPSVRQAFDIARRNRVTTMLDAGPPTSLDDGLLQRTTVLRANADEIGAASGIPVTHPHSALEAARTLLTQGPEVVAVETGDGGNAVLTSNALFAYAADAVEPVDKVGAGDAFSAAFAVALLEGRDLQAAGAMAHGASGYAVNMMGALASLPSTRELKDHLARRGTAAGSAAPG
jgi:ribokinase